MPQDLTYQTRESLEYLSQAREGLGNFLRWLTTTERVVKGIDRLTPRYMSNPRLASTPIERSQEIGPRLCLLLSDLELVADQLAILRGHLAVAIEASCILPDQPQPGPEESDQEVSLLRVENQEIP